MSNDLGLVSVIMPVYNGKAYIKEAIESVLSQTYQNIELLIINDGSTDNSENIIKQHNDLRIRYFVQENKGVSAARNLGLRYMKGQYFCFLDADDILTNHSLRARLKIFEENSHIFFVDGRVEKREENFEALKEVYLPTYKGDPFPELIRLSNSCFFGPSWMIKRDKKKQYQFRTDVTHAEDLLFYISIADKGMYSFTEETILLYRIRHNSAMTDLKGLENGYREVYRTVSSLSNIEKSDLGYLKMRIVRIMVLSYLRSCNLKQAVIAAFSLMKL